MVHKAVAEQEQVQQGGDGWINIPITGDNTFDLLKLKEEGIDLLLGEVEVPIGKYTQIRLIIEEVVIIYDDGTGLTKEENAKLPSNQLKLVRPFDVIYGGVTILLIDFLADQSVNITGKGDIIFKPVIKLVVSVKENSAANTAVIQEPEEDEFEGIILDITGDIWMVDIDGVEVEVDVADAKIKGLGDVGLFAEIKGILIDTNKIKASEVEIEVE